MESVKKKIAVRLRGVALTAAVLCTLGVVGSSQAQTPTKCDPSMACCVSKEIGGDPKCAGASNPIDVITGNKYQREVDLPALPGVLGLEIVRHYNSVYSRAGSDTTNVIGIMGRGWKLSYEVELRVSTNGVTVQIVLADGTPLNFTRGFLNPKRYIAANPANGYITPKDILRGREYTWHQLDGREYSFDVNGNLDSIKAPSGEFVSLQYDLGQLIRVTDPQGRSLNLQYLDRKTAKAGDRFRGVQYIDTPVGRFNYIYGSAKPAGSTIEPVQLLANLVKVTAPGPDEAHRTSRIYHFEDPRFPTLLTGISVAGAGSDGKPMHQRIGTYAYDEHGKANLSVKGEPARLQTDKDGKPLQPYRLVEGTGIEQVVLDHSRPGKTIAHNSLGQTTVFTYAEIAGRARLLEVRGAGCAHCAGPNVRYGYDSFGRLTDTTQITADGQPIQASKSALDLEGRPHSVSRIEYRNGKAQPPQLLVRYSYEGSAPQPTVIARPSVVAGKEHIIRIAYNEAGQPTKITEEGFSPLDDKGQPGVTPISRSTSYSYTTINNSRVLAQIDGPLPNGPKGDPSDSDITRVTWGKQGLFITEVTYPGKRSVQFEVDRNTSQVVTVTQSFDALVERTRYLYAQNGQVQKLTREALSSDSTAVLASRSTNLLYNASGLLAQIEWPNQEPTSIAHDIAGRVQPVRLPDGRDLTMVPSSDPQEKRDPNAQRGLQVLYGPQGSVAEHVALHLEAQGREAERVLDDFGRVVALKNPGQAWQNARYDESGRIVEITDPRGAKTRARYDLAGRLLEITRIAAGHDQAEQTTRLVWQGPYKIEEAVFDAQGRPTQITRTGYAPLGDVQSLQTQVFAQGAMPGATLTEQRRYDEFGRLTTRTLASGQRIAYRYQAGARGGAGRLESIEQFRWPAWADTVVQWLPVSWRPRTVLARLDASGLRATVHASTQKVAHVAPAAPMIEAGLSETAPGEAHDAASLPQRASTSRGTVTLRWDAAGRLGDVIDAQSAVPVARYTYDAQGRRASKTTAGGSEFYLYDGTQLVAVARASGTAKPRVTDAYVYQGWRPVAWFQDGKAYALTTDHRGAVQAVTTTEADPARRRNLWNGHTDAWGIAQVEGAASFDPHLRLVNQYRDEETGWHYNLARYYDPSSGRYLSPDPAGVADSIDDETPNALRLDLTAYAAGRPLDFFDPDGAAKLTYYAITTGSDGKQLGTNQGFTKARWAFIVEGVKPVSGNAGSDPLKALQNQYATDGKAMLFDGGGDFLAAGKSTVNWSASASGIPDLFKEHYGANLISISQFTINDYSDESATQLIASYIAADWAKVSGGGCSVRDLMLPAIKFAPGEADINVTRQVEPAASGMAGSQANKQRILNCDRPTSMPVTYANDEERRRIVKYEAAAELQESPATSTIYRDCSTNNGCRSGTDITVNGHSYYASYGRTQFVAETFLRTLRANVAGMTAAQRTQLRLDQAVLLPDGTMGTMADMVGIANARATAAGTFFRDYRKAYGRGLTVAQATVRWNSLTPAQRSAFTTRTGFGQAEFIDMLGYVASGRARTEAEGLNAFASEAVLRLLDGNGRTTFGSWLMWLYSSQDEYNFVSKTFLKSNLSTILTAPSLRGHFANSEPAGTAAYSRRQREIEDDLTQRVAVMHNWGNERYATAATLSLPSWVQDYANEFDRKVNRGDWRSLRCSDGLRDRPGLEMQTINLR